jgi:type 1 glutamine amidotransferase
MRHRRDKGEDMPQLPEALHRLIGGGRTALLLCAAAAAAPVGAQTMNPDASFSILVFSKTAGYRHESIEAGIAALRALGAQHGFQVQTTEASESFDDEGLAQHQVVVFLNTTGDVLQPAQEAAFQRFIRRGGGFVGIHSATDTEYDWPWYGALVGAYFKGHPRIQEARLQVIRDDHPSTRGLPGEWVRRDEWYNFREDPSPNVTTLVLLDETSYTGGTMSTRHPVAWYHEYDGGRAWYTALGHTVESYAEPLFRAHLLGGIRWAAGMPDN